MVCCIFVYNTMSVQEKKLSSILKESPKHWILPTTNLLFIELLLGAKQCFSWVYHQAAMFFLSTAGLRNNGGQWSVGLHTKTTEVQSTKVFGYADPHWDVIYCSN